jgi:RNA polymerase sigma-70 factor (ECF subfamily)
MARHDAGANDTAGLFTRSIVPHLPAAYRLARWLLRDPAIAEDVVQDAMERAWRYIATFRGDNERAWLLRIVRNQAMEQRAKSRPMEELNDDMAAALPSPEDDALHAQGTLALNDALAALPAPLRECIVLRELEECSYREMAEILGIPIGTVMSRLWAARRALMDLTKGFRQ